MFTASQSSSKLNRRSFQVLKQGFQNPRRLILFVFGRIHIVRETVNFLSRQPLAETYVAGNTCFRDLNVDQAVETLRMEGLCGGINLPQDILQEIQGFAETAAYLGNADPQFQFFLTDKEKEELNAPKIFATGHHFNPSQQCPAIKKLEDDPKIRAVAAKYLQTNPVLIESRLRWTFVTNKEDVSGAQSGVFNFHYDLEDYRFIKFMFYLTKVDSSSGPHVCVKGSHRNKKLRHQFSWIRERDDQEISDCYGPENVRTICGEAGYGFVEDFYCFHKATFPTHRNRLLLEIKFGTRHYGLV